MKTCFIRYLCFCLFYFSCLSQIGVGAWTDTGGGDHSNSYWEPVSGSTIAGYHFNISSFTVPSGATIYVQPYDGDSVSTTDPCTSSGRGYCDNGGTPSGFIEIEAGTVTIDGALEASGRGYRKGAIGEGPGGGPVSGNGGGGYGGKGGIGWGGTSGGAVYGDLIAPFYMGSGGAHWSEGGSGGGLVVFKTTFTFTISGLGQIQANGEGGGLGPNSNDGGGGSGGGIYINAPTIELGNGAIISAAGGGGNRSCGGPFSGQSGRNGTGGNGSDGLAGGGPGIPGNGGNSDAAGGASAGGGGGSCSSSGGGGGSGRVFMKYTTINDSNNGSADYWTPTAGITAGPYPYLILINTPNQPTSLAASFADSTSSNTLKLDWLDNSDNETGFRLQRSSDNVTFNLVDGSISADATTYIDTGLLANTTYWFRVQAYNGIGNSAWANSSPKATLARQVTNPQVYAVYGSSITVTWTPVSAGQANSYTLQASTDSDFTTIAKSSSTTNIAVSTLTLIDFTVGATYYFRIASYNHGNTANYAIDGSTYFMPVPIAPASLTSSLINTTSTDTLKLDWLDNSNNETGFRLERSSDNVTFNLVDGLISADATTYIDTGLLANTTYWFRALAYNGTGNSTWANSSPKATLASQVTNPQVYAVYAGSITVSWTPVGAGQAVSYTVQASSESNFNTVLKSSSTTDIAVSALTVVDFTKSATYYFRIASYNHGNIANYAVDGSTYLQQISWTVLEGGDHNGADWTPVNGSTIAGYHYNIGSFTIESGATVYVLPYDGTPVWDSLSLLPSSRGYADNEYTPSGFVEIEAATAAINGVLEASGRGYRPASSTGEGTGGGATWNWNGGGGGYGGSGGQNGAAAGGAAYGVSTGPFYMGSAGGSAVAGTGGKGGGLVIVRATYSFTMSGTGQIQANGYSGVVGGNYAGGGGAGGGIYLDAQTVSINSVSILSVAGAGGGGYNTTGSAGHNGAGGTGGGPGATAGGGPGIPGNGAGASAGYSAGGRGELGGGGGSGRILIRYWSINDNDYTNGYWDPSSNISNTTFGPWPWLVYTGLPPDPPTVGSITNVYTSSITANWGSVSGVTGYTLAASTESTNPPVTIWASSTTVGVDSTTATVYTPALNPNTTYYLFVRATRNSQNSSYAAYPATSTLAALVNSPQVYAVYLTSVTVNWTPVGVGQANSYVLQASTDSNFSPVYTSSSTANILLSTLTVVNLSGDTTYYFRVGSVNHNNVSNYAVDGSTYIPLVVGVSVDINTYNFGTVQMGATTVSTQAVVVTNTGNTSERYQLKAATSTAGSPWNVLTATPTVHNGLVLFGTFHNVQPSSTNFTTQDVITETNQQSQTVSQGGRYTVDDTEAGVAVPYTDTRRLWFYLNMPLSTSTTVQQKIDVTITAEQSP